MSSSITVAICDDHGLFRKGIEGCLKTFRDIKIVHGCENGAELIKYLHKEPHPAIVLMDIKMPVMNGYECTGYVKKHYPEIKVISMSSFDNDFSIAQIIECGADSFISKNADPEELYNTIVNVYSKGFYVTKWIKVKNIRKLNLNILTPKEKELLPLLCSGKSYNDIAIKLGVSVKTVDRHRDEIFKKLNVQSRLNLALFAITNGIVV